MFPVALDDAMWKKAGVDLAKLTPAPQGGPNVKEGIIPMFKFAGFDLPQIPAVEGSPVSDLKANVDMDLGGVLGAGLLSLFRVTFGDDGRFMWLEADPALLAPPTGRASGESPQQDRRGGPPKPPMVPDDAKKGPAPAAAPAPAPAAKPGGKP
jgi:hypothetical protein